MSKVIVFGSLNMDLSVECDRLPSAGETVFGHGFVSSPGGKGANQAMAAALMGATTHMVGSVGRDTFGTRLLQSLVGAGVLCKYVNVVEDVSTGTATIVRAESNNRIIVDPGANACTTTDTICAAIEKLAEPGAVFLTQLECDLDTTLDAIAYAKEFGYYTVLNAAPACNLPSDIYQFLDLICVNEVECRGLTDIDPTDDTNQMRALMTLSARGVPCSVITLGPRGSIALISDELVRIPAGAVQVVDTTGAGDAYIGALVAEVARGGSLVDGLRLASVAGSLVTTKVGAQDAMPSREEVEAFLAESVR